MNDREKLIELIDKARKAMKKEQLSCDLARNIFIAEYLIANGVVIVVRCKECYKRCDPFKCPKCILADDGLWYESTTGNGYCDRGERK